MNALRKIIIALLMTVAVSVAAAPTDAQAQQGAVTSTSAFYEPLSSYGDWYYTDAYGWVWSPWGVSSNWRPYTVGNWVYTDAYGWMWASEEPWAWAAYHYGRWTFLGGAWVWVPDTMWGPAWVAWAQADNYVGWAPLPPGAAINAYSGTVNLNVNIGWQYWSYVPAAYMLEVNLYPYYLPANRVQVVYRRAVPVTRYRIYGGTVACVGVSTTWVSGWIGYAVPTVTVTWTSAPGAYYRHGTYYAYRTPPPPGRPTATPRPLPSGRCPRGCGPASPSRRRRPTATAAGSPRPRRPPPAAAGATGRRRPPAGAPALGRPRRP